MDNSDTVTRKRSRRILELSFKNDTSKPEPQSTKSHLLYRKVFKRLSHTSSINKIFTSPRSGQTFHELNPVALSLPRSNDTEILNPDEDHNSVIGFLSNFLEHIPPSNISAVPYNNNKTDLGFSNETIKDLKDDTNRKIQILEDMNIITPIHANSNTNSIRNLIISPRKFCLKTT
ncbi:unnamed protein product [Arctia plantaginis]|uniref:Uncharacterized protein n=1 Tax=Arctia plantaginis TaxID=874455 RepID=A0A8S0ZES5_ARCPL|nr:unnamed protein product [Arctia plantaginis]CAB3232048.1 unnamed protein product [Arctia plantaginis]